MMVENRQIFFIIPLLVGCASSSRRLHMCHPPHPSISILIFFHSALYSQNLPFSVSPSLSLPLSGNLTARGSRGFKQHNAEQILPRSSWIPSPASRSRIVVPVYIPPRITKLTLSLPSTAGCISLLNHCLRI